MRNNSIFEKFLIIRRREKASTERYVLEKSPAMCNINAGSRLFVRVSLLTDRIEQPEPEQEVLL